MKMLITGGAGFIGSHLAEACLGRGDEVYIIDDLSTGALDNIKHLQQHAEHGERLFVTIDTVLNYDKMLELYPDRANPGSLWSSAAAAKAET